MGRLLGGSVVGLTVTSSKRADATGYVCDPGLLRSEPMAVWQATADLSLRRGHSHTQRQADPLDWERLFTCRAGLQPADTDFSSH